MDLFLLRHAIASGPEAGDFPDDSRRPLTKEGAERMRRIARGMHALDLPLERILSSPFLRAKESAEIVAEEFHLKSALELTPELQPGGDPRKLLAVVNARAVNFQHILLVGHEPSLSELISVLLGGKAQVGVTMKKGGLCHLRSDHLSYGKCATLEALLAPRHLVRIH
jgi:phosphohistidine phosphatase